MSKPSAVAEARLALLYHSVWEQRVATETFARWGREDFVELAGVAEAVWAYDRSDSPHEGGSERVLGVSQVLHRWAAQLEGYRRAVREYNLGLSTTEPVDPFPIAGHADVRGDCPNSMFRRLAGSMLRLGTFAEVVAPNRSWISRTSPEQLHRVLEVEAKRRDSISDRVRARQLALGERQEAAVAAADRVIDWAPIEARLQLQMISRNVGV